MAYQKGGYAKAGRLFEEAYQGDPDNFDFLLSFAMAQSRAGKPNEAFLLLEKAHKTIAAKTDASVSGLQSRPKRLGSRLQVYDESRNASLSALHFFKGVTYLNMGAHNQAIPLLKESLLQADTINHSDEASIIANSVGYALFMNQGRGANEDHGKTRHHHIQRPDMLRALPYFEMAVRLNPDNPDARHNYLLICDSLLITPQIPQPLYRNKPDMGPSISNLPGNATRALSMTNYQDILFLLDISGSMVMEKVKCLGKDRFEVMKETASLLLENLDTTMQLGIATIDGDCGRPPQQWTEVGRISKADLTDKIRFLIPNGATPLLERIMASVELFSPTPDTRRMPASVQDPKNSGNRSIFLVSDGENVCRLPGVDVCEWAETLRARNITINVLTFLSADDRNANAFAEYTCLASLSGGQVLYIDELSCSLQYHAFNPLKVCTFRLPPLQRVNCWGASVSELWAY